MSPAADGRYDREFVTIVDREILVDVLLVDSCADCGAVRRDLWVVRHKPVKYDTNRFGLIQPHLEPTRADGFPHNREKHDLKGMRMLVARHAAVHRHAENRMVRTGSILEATRAGAYPATTQSASAITATTMKSSPSSRIGAVSMK